MNATVSEFLRARTDARRTGDRGLEAAMTQELRHIGYRDPEPPAGLETAVPAPMERAVPRKGGRPKLPRCEHDRIVGRCHDCNDHSGDDAA